MFCHQHRYRSLLVCWPPAKRFAVCPSPTLNKGHEGTRRPVFVGTTSVRLCHHCWVVITAFQRDHIVMKWSDDEDHCCICYISSWNTLLMFGRFALLFLLQFSSLFWTLILSGSRSANRFADAEVCSRCWDLGGVLSCDIFLCLHPLTVSQKLRPHDYVTAQLFTPLRIKIRMINFSLWRIIHQVSAEMILIQMMWKPFISVWFS